MESILSPIVVPPSGHHQATVIWLHGLGADGHDFEPIIPELGLPKGHGIKFLFPNAPLRPVTVNGGYVMRAWYDIQGNDLRQREDADGVRASCNTLDALIENEVSQRIRPEKILLAGFSQGGAVVLHCGIRRRQKLAGILALSTYLPLPNLAASEHAVQALGTPILMCHGRADPIIPLVQGQQSASYLKTIGHVVEWREYLMGHEVCAEEIDHLGNWLNERLLA